MNAPESLPLEVGTVLWRLAATMFFVVLNGFFVATEFGLVKVRGARIEALADLGNKRARMARRILARLDLYLSSCQFGITVASLILGWLAEPAIAQVLVAGAAKLGWVVGDSAVVHGIALAVALTIVTALHMTIGEQAPKIWAIQRPEPMVLAAAHPLRIFTLVFGPLIGIINHLSNAVLRLLGTTPGGDHEAPLSPGELRAVLAASAHAGHITVRQRTFAENILRFIDLEVRHVLVPRVDVAWLTRETPIERIIALIDESGHSRFPLCDEDLDSVIGIVHAKDVLLAHAAQRPRDLQELARPALFVPDTQPLGKMIAELQQVQRHCAVVVDDHGTAIGLAFLEDALEEIVGPIRDEFDQAEVRVTEVDGGAVELNGDLALPEAVALLGLEPADDDDTIGGHVTSLLGRLPKVGEELKLGPYTVRVLEVKRHRVLRLRFERAKVEGAPEASD